MSKLTRPELLLKFFPEMASKVTKGDREAAVRYNMLACEAILADQLRLYDNGFEQQGPGVLCVRIHRDASESCYLPLADLQEDLETAKTSGNSGLESFLKDAVSRIEECNISRAGLIMLLDNSTAQLFRLDREYPAKEIKAMLEAL